MGRVPGRARLASLSFVSAGTPFPLRGSDTKSCRASGTLHPSSGAGDWASPVQGPTARVPASRWPEAPSHQGGRHQVQMQQESPHGVPGTQPPPSHGTDSHGLSLESQTAH